MNVTDSDASRAEGFEPPFRVIVSTRADGTLVVPHGELDVATAPDLEAVLAAQEGGVVVDLRKLTFVDLAGLRLLLEAETRCRQDGMNLRLIGGPVVRRLFELVGMPDRFDGVD